jgi:hypothetical protein
MKQTYYIVQRCWFDGPHASPPVDYMALFPDQSSAESCAYQSAHLYSSTQQANHLQPGVVRVLLLPSGFACSAAGKLFWVRRVIADLFMGGDSAGAHCILRNGIVGGTGNANSRRGSEAEADCVFVGADSHTRAQLAMEQQQWQPSVISWLPIGCYSDIVQGWPDLHSLNEEKMVDNEPLLSKRQALEDQQQCHHNQSATHPAKRICGVHQRNSFTTTTMETTSDANTSTSYM